jgi:hypothetical protein
MELSNKSLALLLVAAIVISLGGTLISLNRLSQQGLTGLAAGTVVLNVSENMSCTIGSNVSFGISTSQILAQTNISTNSANSNGFNDCTGNDACRGMMINNTGNVNVNVTFYSSANGTTLLGGPGATNASFQYSIVNGSFNGAALPGCNSGLKTAWGYANETITTICTNLTSLSTNNVMTIEYNVTIDANTPTGYKTATITITCARNY